MHEITVGPFPFLVLLNFLWIIFPDPGCASTRRSDRSLTSIDLLHFQLCQVQAITRGWGVVMAVLAYFFPHVRPGVSGPGSGERLPVVYYRRAVESCVPRAGEGSFLTDLRGGGVETRRAFRVNNVSCGSRRRPSMIVPIL